MRQSAEQGVMPEVPASRHYKDGFATRHMIKDLGLAMSAAEHAGSATPMAKEAVKLYQKVRKGTMISRILLQHLLQHFCER